MIEYKDVKVPGLVLLVRDSELKTFAVRYRDKDGTKQRYRIGRYPDVRLSLARQEAERILEAVCVQTFPIDW